MVSSTLARPRKLIKKEYCPVEVDMLCPGSGLRILKTLVLVHGIAILLDPQLGNAFASLVCTYMCLLTGNCFLQMMIVGGLPWGLGV